MNFKNFWCSALQRKIHKSANVKIIMVVSCMTAKKSDIVSTDLVEEFIKYQIIKL